MMLAHTQLKYEVTLRGEFNNAIPIKCHPVIVNHLAAGRHITIRQLR